MNRRAAAACVALAFSIGLAFAAPAPVSAQGTVVERGQTQCRQVALTFDAGSVAVSGQGILDALAEHGIRSTFFLTGQWVDDYPDMAAEITARGHDVGNHTNSHPEMPTLAVSTMRAELRTAEAKILSAAGKNPRPLWRPPYGEWDNTVVQVASEEGYPWTIMWDIDTIDWQNPPVQTIVDRVTTRVRPGSVVLMHMGGENTADAVTQMLPLLERKGYMMVTVGEVLGLTRAGAEFGGRVVYVQSGDTLNKIAGCFNTTSPILAAANDIADPNRIFPNQRLYVPLRDEVTIRVNGVRLNLAVPALIQNGRTLGHVRPLANALGAAVSWDDATQSVTLTKGGTTIVMKLGVTTATVNGVAKSLDVAPFLVQDRLQVPVRFVAESLGGSVAWDPVSRTVIINSTP